MRKRQRDRLYADLVKRATTADVDAAIATVERIAENPLTISGSLGERNALLLAAALLRFAHEDPVVVAPWPW